MQIPTHTQAPTANNCYLKQSNTFHGRSASGGPGSRHAGRPNCWGHARMELRTCTREHASTGEQTTCTCTLITQSSPSQAATKGPAVSLGSALLMAWHFRTVIRFSYAWTTSSCKSRQLRVLLVLAGKNTGGSSPQLSPLRATHAAHHHLPWGSEPRVLHRMPVTIFARGN